MNKAKYIVKFTLENEAVWCNYEFIPNSATTGEDLTDALEVMLRAKNSFLEEVEKL
ncbi:MAG: hypothetical protein IJS63_05335 [Bacteroidaceae bacterium]|nr:hypothetical protein [Bacteroidaceae bacterium]